MRDFTGKVALVTGGSRGIGAAVVKQFASQGADVAVVYAGNQELAEALCAQCAADYGVKAIAYRCDVADFAAVKDTVNQVKKDFGSVDILVNNAGITQDGLLAMMKEEAFDRVLDVDLKGAFHFIRHCTGLFLRKKAGAIVNVASVSGLIGNAGQANYSAAKAGLIGLTKAVAKELAPKGITCNAVAPGFVATDMTKDLEGQDNALLAAIPLGRMGQPEEVAEAVAFLAQSPYCVAHGADDAQAGDHHSACLFHCVCSSLLGHRSRPGKGLLRENQLKKLHGDAAVDPQHLAGDIGAWGQKGHGL